ncbi:hypothetical protein DFQ27_004607 [Actinomortierella ambigua]|uniref:Bud22 domain-containing protein n=1 Tax=Actinomortierella ambigua TaxID=1343610 RepID=A0A9P6Q1I0_9FUNG|nr:hypothetical protein DFQ27_004607 [Actinomortierella ambigua]
MAIEKSGKSKKVNLGWKMAKLQAMAGGDVSRKAKKAAEAELKKKKQTAAGADESSDDDGEREADDSLQQELSKQAAAELEQVKAQKIENKIHHGKKVLLKTIKQAKQHEIQRLNKRIRELKKLAEDEAGQKENKMKKTKQDLPSLELELELTQNMSSELVDEEALHARLAKHPVLATHSLMEKYTKPLPENPDFPLTADYVKKKYPGGTPAEIKTTLVTILLPRLKNVKAVREHLNQLMDDLELIATGRKYEKPAKPQQQLQQMKQQGKGGKADNKQKEAVFDDDSEADGEDNDDNEEEEGDDDMDNDSDNSYGVYDDGYDSDGLPLPMDGKSKGSGREPSSLFIGSLNAGSKEDKKRKRGGSKDDWVDEKFDEIYGKVKRNRQGQRARRALAEKKFGKQANHILKAQEEEKKRQEEKAAKKAARDVRRAARRAAGIVPESGSSANATKLHNQRSMGGQAPVAAAAGQSKAEAGGKPDASDPTLHPSWLAKKSEAAAVAAALAGGKSNKIVFDDSD